MSTNAIAVSSPAPGERPFGDPCDIYYAVERVSLTLDRLRMYLSDDVKADREGDSVARSHFDGTLTALHAITASGANELRSVTDMYCWRNDRITAVYAYKAEAIVVAVGALAWTLKQRESQVLPFDAPTLTEAIEMLIHTLAEEYAVRAKLKELQDAENSVTKQATDLEDLRPNTRTTEKIQTAKENA